MLKCKDCEKYWKTAEPEHGVCSLPDSFFPTDADNECVFLNNTKKHCSDCISYVENDFGCLTVDANSEICSGFEPAYLSKLKEAIFEIMLNEDDVDEILRETLCEVHNSDVMQFILAHGCVPLNG